MPAFDPPVLRFNGFELDRSRFELRQGSERVPIQPQVLGLLILLVENRERMVGKDQIVDAVWDGRIVSESAIASRIKDARKAIGDDGVSQQFIRTVHGRGFRFVGEVEEIEAAPPSCAVTVTQSRAERLEPAPHRSARDGRPAIAVLPFVMNGEAGPHAIIADALPADIIMDLSRLHGLFVIARGSSFRFRGADVDPVAVGRELDIGYCLTGSVELVGREVRISAGLVDTADGVMLWAETYHVALDELQQMRPEIEAQVVAALSVHIQSNEVRIARSRPASELDAWASYHLGLDQMYRFTQPGNANAARLFTQSLSTDPDFSRALGGLSFTHFQNAFLGFSNDPAADKAAARSLAQRAYDADRIDPFACFNVGRSLWLEGQLDESMQWFDRSTSLSPNFAQGIYNRGLVGTMAGKAEGAEADLALALELSPLDPLAYAMVASRALIQVQFGEYEKAAELGAKAAMMPGAHKHIALIAALTAQLANRREDAQAWLARSRMSDPGINAEVFFRAFPFAPTLAREVLERSFAELAI